MYQIMNTNHIKSILTMAGVFFFFTGLPVYLFILGYSALTPLFWIELFAVVVLLNFIVNVIATGANYKIIIPKSLLYWTLLFAEVSILWFTFSTQTEIAVQVFRRRLLSLIFMFLFYFMLYDNKKLQLKTRYILLLSTLLAVVNNIYDLIKPFSFVPLTSEYSNPGRAAGLYINANGAGCALILGMIFSVGLLSKKYRTLYVFIILGGVILTFSRAAVIGWILVTLILILQNVLPKKHIFMGLVMFIFFISVFILFLPVFFQQDTGLSIASMFERVGWVFDPAGVQDVSTEERSRVLGLSWKMFTDHPLIGNGLGSTESWSERSSTHNMYLYFMADHGIIGALILPLFCLAAVWRAQGEALQMAIPFVLFIMFFGLFSHNVIDDYCTLICYALMSAITIGSKFKQYNTHSGITI